MVEHASGRRKRRFRKMQKISIEGGLGRIGELRLKKVWIKESGSYILW